MLCSFFAASVGIIVMIIASPLLVEISFKFGPPEIFSIMLLGLLAGATMSRGSPLKGVAMVVIGLLLGVAGTDVLTGTQRFTFGITDLDDGVELVALALGLFGVAEFLRSVNRMDSVGTPIRMRMRDMRPSLAELRQAFPAMLRGTGSRRAVRRHSGHRADDHHLHRLRAGTQDSPAIRSASARARSRAWRRRRRPRIPRRRSISSRP